LSATYNKNYKKVLPLIKIKKSKQQIICTILCKAGWQVFIPSKSVVTIFLERECTIGIKFLSPSTSP
jgi:hypothetical protein